jgi:hypothetical protein
MSGRPRRMLEATVRRANGKRSGPAPGPGGAAPAARARVLGPQSGGAVPGPDKVVAGAVDLCPLDGVEPTNNAAERALRPAVLWRKGSFGSDCGAGSRFAERLLTVVASCRQQGRPLLAFLVATGAAALQGSLPPSLLPAPEGAERTTQCLAAACGLASRRAAAIIAGAAGVLSPQQVRSAH